MTSVKVIFIDNSMQAFSSANGLIVSNEQYWVKILDGEGRQIASIPIQQIKFVATPNSVV